MQVEFAIDELETLASALVRLKFEDEEPPEPYFGSPRLAQAHRRIVDSIILESGRIGDSGRVARWETWRKWSARGYEKGIVVRYASSLDLWDEWGDGQKLEALRTCAAPFSPSEEELKELRNDIDAVRSSPSSDDLSRDA